MESAPYTVDLDETAASPSPFKVDIVRMIPLETTNESIIDAIKKVVFKNNRLYIQDRSSHKLQIFSIDGKYIGSLSRQGKGPGEYIRLTDFDVDNDYIYVLSADNKKIIQYSCDDFNKSVEIKLPETVSKIRISDGNIWVGDIFTYQGLHELALLEKGAIKPFLEVRKEMDNTVSETPVELKPQIFFSSEEYTLFNQRFTGDVYQLDADGPKLLLRATSRLPTSGNIRDENSFDGFYSIYRIKDMLLGTLWGRTKYPFLFVMNLKSGTSSLCDLGDIGLPSLNTITSFEGQFVTFMSARAFIEGNFDARLKNNIDTGNMDESDNPVAVMFSLIEEPD